MDLRKKIELLRKQKGMSQEMLAFKLQVSRQSVFKWECGESTPSIDKLKELSKLFEVSLDYLLNDEKELDDSKQKEVSKPTSVKYRNVFVSNVELHFDKDVAIQSGYYIGNKYKQYSLETKFEGLNANNLKGIKFNKKLLFCQDSNSCVLIDTENNTFSIYSELAEQFICPFENLISITLTDAGARTVINHNRVSGGAIGLNGGGGIMFGENSSFGKSASAIYYIDFSYHDKNGGIKSYKFKVLAYRNHLLYTKNFNDTNFYNFFIDGLCNEIRNNLIKIKQTIETFVKESQVNKQLNEIDIEHKRIVVEGSRSVLNQEYATNKLVEAKSQRNASTLLIVFEVVLPILLFIAFIIVIVVVLKKYI